LCCVFYFASSCVLCVASFSGFSFFDCPSVFSNVYLGSVCVIFSYIHGENKTDNVQCRLNKCGNWTNLWTEG
jgi:hypothetical protein